MKNTVKARIALCRAGISAMTYEYYDHCINHTNAAPQEKIDNAFWSTIRFWKSLSCDEKSELLEFMIGRNHQALYQKTYDGDEYCERLSAYYNLTDSLADAFYYEYMGAGA